MAFGAVEILKVGARIYKANAIPLIVASFVTPVMVFGSAGFLSFSAFVGIFNLLRNSTYTSDGAYNKGVLSDLWIGYRPLNPLTLAHGLVWGMQFFLFTVLLFPVGGFYATALHFFAPFYTCEDLLDRTESLPRMFSQTYFESKVIVRQMGLTGAIVRILLTLWFLHGAIFWIFIWFGWLWFFVEFVVMLPWSMATLYAVYMRCAIENNMHPASSPSRPKRMESRRMSKSEVDLKAMEEGRKAPSGGHRTPQGSKKSPKPIPSPGKRTRHSRHASEVPVSDLVLNSFLTPGEVGSPQGGTVGLPSYTPNESPRSISGGVPEEEVEEDRRGRKSKKNRSRPSKSRSASKGRTGRKGRSQSGGRDNYSNSSGSDGGGRSDNDKQKGKGKGRRGRGRPSDRSDSEQSEPGARRGRGDKRARGRPKSAGRRDDSESDE